MLLIYSPAGQDAREFTFDPDTVPVTDAEAIEELGGNAWQSYGQFATAYRLGKVRALRVALFVCMRRDNPSLSFDQLDSALAGEIGKSYDTAELLAMRKVWLESEQPVDAIRVNIALIDQMLVDRGETPPAADDEELLDPKADPSPSPDDSQKRGTRSRSSGTSTGGRSRSSSAVPRRSRTGGRSTSSRTPAT